MKDRRDFLKTGFAASAALIAGCSPSAEDGSASTPAAEEVPVKGPVTRPIIISTWDHGRQANAEAWGTLGAGGSVLDAVERGVMVVESDLRNRSVGLGGLPDRDGHTTLDACIQDHDCQCGSVAFLEHIEHPISVARAVMERTPHVMLVGEGAYQWARANGFPERQVDLPEVRAAYATWLLRSRYEPVVNRENHDTIGLLAMDANGRLAGSCTTSGMAYKIHGRVGDSPLIGAGLFVDGDAGAACATGTGELVIRVAGSHTVVELMRQGLDPVDACKEAIRRILRTTKEPRNHQVGFLAIRKDGRIGAWSLQPGFSYAVRAEGRDELLDAGSTLTEAGTGNS